LLPEHIPNPGLLWTSLLVFCQLAVYLVMDGKIDEVDVNEIVCEGMDWINLAQGRDNWWVFLNIVMNL